MPSRPKQPDFVLGFSGGTGEVLVFNHAKLPDATLDQLLDRFTLTVQRLRLIDWTIHLELRRRMNGIAECDAQPEYKIATIRVCVTKLHQHWVPGLFYHELLHCVVQPLGDFTERLAGDNTGQREMSRYLEEQLVTNLEQVFVAMDKELSRDTE